LKAIVDKPNEVNQIPTTGQIAKKKCNERELLNATAFMNSNKRVDFIIFQFDLETWYKVFEG
jgi:hypothetical protein